MPSNTYTLFREAILAEQQVTCSYSGHRRKLCPHIIGTNKAGDEVVLAWQFGGGSSGRLPPGGEWRCLTIAKVSSALRHDGPWHSGGDHRATQTCVVNIDLDINVHVRKLR